MKDFTKWFKEKKQTLNLTQPQIAAGLGMSLRMVTLWESGTIPRASTRKKLEDFFAAEEQKKQKLNVVDRSIINEVLLRNLLRQIAKMRSKMEHRSLADLEQEINADNLEVLQDLETKLGRKD